MGPGLPVAVYGETLANRMPTAYHLLYTASRTRGDVTASAPAMPEAGPFLALVDLLPATFPGRLRRLRTGRTQVQERLEAKTYQYHASYARALINDRSLDRVRTVLLFALPPGSPRRPSNRLLV
jgi:hypothetical protein